MTCDQNITIFSVPPIFYHLEYYMLEFKINIDSF